eukprot:355244-Chlamydomonas_euryale.AAC.2
MAQPDLGLGYVVSGGSTLSEDDSPQQNDDGASVRGLSGTRAGPEDGIAPENTGCIVILSQGSEGAMTEASAGLEITDGVSPPDRSARDICEHGERAQKAIDAEFRAAQEKHAAMLAHNKANKRRPGRLGRGGRGHARMSNAQQPATAGQQVEHVQET